jgi:heme/copper-type cytochrome/quinol oxidase subunit 2
MTSIPPRLARRISDKTKRKGLFHPANVAIGVFIALLWFGSIYMNLAGIVIIPGSAVGAIEFEIHIEEPAGGVDYTIVGTIWEDGGWNPSVITLPASNTSYVFKITASDTFHGWAIEKIGLDTGGIARGESRYASITFNIPGQSYIFICSITCSPGHSQMTGTINVT